MADDVRVTEVRALPRRDDGRVDAAAVSRALFGGAVLESASATQTGWSYAVARRIADLSVRPRQERATWITFEDADRDPLLRSVPRLHRAEERDPTDPRPEVLALLDTLSNALGLVPEAARDASLPPFTGGWVGSFSHDLARRIERLPDLRPPAREADVDLQLVDTVLAWRDDLDTAYLVHRPLGGGAVDVDGIVERLAAQPPEPPESSAPDRAQPVVSSLGRRGHRAAVETALEHIAAGDAFQINVTHQLSTAWRGTTWGLYRALRAASPASYGAVLPSQGIASVSPETFLEVEGRRTRIRPIKGTRARHEHPDADAAAARELQESAKDRAENVMVVDMERNDLGRVSEIGSVTVPSLLDVERHPTVWHLVSTVEGTLRRGVGWGALLTATFPCGSVTGTPKVRALELIEQIEPVRRGVYCGAIGFFSAGAAHTSVAIRTAVLGRDGTASYGTGGGIVADSHPDDEWQESLDKAAAFFAATASTLREDQP